MSLKLEYDYPWNCSNLSNTSARGAYDVWRDDVRWTAKPSHDFLWDCFGVTNKLRHNITRNSPAPAKQIRLERQLSLELPIPCLSVELGANRAEAFTRHPPTGMINNIIAEIDVPGTANHRVVYGIVMLTYHIRADPLRCMCAQCDFCSTFRPRCCLWNCRGVARGGSHEAPTYRTIQSCLERQVCEEPPTPWLPTEQLL